jgi:hypothetical protein
MKHIEASKLYLPQAARGRRRWTFKLIPVAIIASVALIGCDGPNEQAGREKDKAEATAAGQNYTGTGPNERIGEAEDRAANALRHERDAAADAIEAQGETIQRQADVTADRLSEEAKAIREAADKQADALKEKAEAAR